MALPSLQAGIASLTIEDERQLTTPTMTAIAARLNAQWKDFARIVGPIEDYEIDSIEQDYTTVKERCYQMLRLWQQKSSVNVTIAMVKLNLQQLGRNDILLDVFNQDDANNEHRMQVQGAGSVPEAGEVAVRRSVASIADLRLTHEKKLKMFLDPEHGAGIKNWLHLGYELTKDNRELTERVEDLRLDYAGGGSPAMALFQALAMNKPTLTVLEFLTTAEGLDRNDIVLYINTNVLDLEMQFRNIDPIHKGKFASMLNKHVHGISDWRSFADEYGYNNEQISNMAVAIKQENSYSPTLKLIQYLRQVKPDMPLTEVKTACERLCRRDVELYLDEIINEIENRT